jgi:TldD protein
MDQIFKDVAGSAIRAAKKAGASYADCRAMTTERESISTRNGAAASRIQENQGFGVRVIADGAWGFSSSSVVTLAEAEAVAREAVAIARASSLTTAIAVKLAPVEPFQAHWVTPYHFDPFDVPLSTKVELLLKIDSALRREKKVRVATGSFSCQWEHQIFASTEGSFIEQHLLTTGIGYAATAVDSNGIQRRSYPNSFRGQHKNMGYELVHRWKLLEEAPRVASQAAALLTADVCPSGRKDIILDSSQIGLQVHESCGHPIELDRVFGTEANYAGRSFLTTEKLGKFQYGSKHVHLTADSTATGGLGTFGYDDEGVAAQKWDIVKEGRFVGYLTSRETAPVIGLPHSQGSMRAAGWNRIPLIRMNNVSLQPGHGSLDDLIGDTKDGLYMETNRSWSIDQLRYNFQFGCEAAWEIKNGKKGRLLRNPTYQGITPEFWGSCDGVCGPEEWILWGTPNCGKGQPGQTAATGHGASPARFRNVKVGVTHAKR